MAAQGQTVFLASSQGKVERHILGQWIARQNEAAGSTVIHYETPRDAPASGELVKSLAGKSDYANDKVLAPVRVIWRAPKRTGLYNPRWLDGVLMRNPRDPGERAKARLAKEDNGRWQVIPGEPASMGDLRDRWKIRASTEQAGDPHEFAQFVARQAELSLERAEYQVRGARYKVPRVYREDVAGSGQFAEGVARLAAELDRDAVSVRNEALEYLDELRTAHDPFVLDLAAKWFHKMYARGYGDVDLDPEQIEMLRETFAKHPVLLLPSHKTNLDSPVLESVLAQQDLPPPTLFAGINMSYWPVGPLMRRAGRVFLRRKISDNPIYKFALREWLSYLIEKRFNLEWFPEGTRSRTGKLLPPKLGLLAYAADAFRQGNVDDLLLVPISIIYDQATEVSGYAREAAGEKKKAENLAWMLKGMRELGEPQGKVYMRIAEPLSMRAALGAPDPEVDGDDDEQRLALHKLALAVAWQTNQVTPITGISIVTFALLAAGQRAVTMRRIFPYVRLLVRQARDRGQPLTASAQIDTEQQVEEILAELVRTGVVRQHENVLDPVYSIAEGQHLTAAYYRNAMLHFVLDRAIGELALLTAAEEPAEYREDRFWKAAVRLRAALKFEFFFRERPDFEESLKQEMDLIHPDWLTLLKEGDDPTSIHRAVYRLGLAHAVLRPFVEAYHVVAQVLVREPADESVESDSFLDKCLKLGRQLQLEQELRNPESVSKQLFETGLDLVRNLKLDGPAPDSGDRRQVFADRCLAELRRIDTAEDNVIRNITEASD